MVTYINLALVLVLTGICWYQQHRIHMVSLSVNALVAYIQETDDVSVVEMLETVAKGQLNQKIKKVIEEVDHE